MTNNARATWTALFGLGLVALVLLWSLRASYESGAWSNRAPVPPGYAERLRFTHEGRALGFGPFVGYAFKRTEEQDPTRVVFQCRNERQFYTKDLPAGALLFTGTGRLATLPETGHGIPAGRRIVPVFFADAPQAWTDTRPAPQEAFRHFHSCYDEAGAMRTGYWLKHRAVASFTYNMG